VLKFNDSFVHVLASRQTDIKMLEELKLVTCLLSKIAPFGKRFSNFILFLIRACLLKNLKKKKMN
jgi:hypothetical protein